MALTIDEANATIETEVSGARPDVKFRDAIPGNVAYWNLTTGFNQIPAQLGSAFTFTGRVGVSGTPADIAQTKFGFIQFMKIREYRIVWSGRGATEGSIVLDLARAVKTNPILDCAPTSRPPFFTVPNGAVRNGEMVTTMGDHPFTRVGDVVHNEVTGFDNYIHSIVDRRVATSVFVAQGPDGRIRPLAHVSFAIEYIMDIRWQDKLTQLVPSAANNRSSFTVGFVGGGAPPESEVPRAALLGAAGFNGPLANKASQDAIANLANFQQLKQAQIGGAQPFFSF